MSQTRRQHLRELLSGDAWGVHELAEETRRPVRDVADDLEHLRRSLGRAAFAVTPASCSGCGFVFAKRDRLLPPSRCPRCRSEQIVEAQVRIVGGERIPG